MDTNREKSGELLQRIDKMIEELQQVRLEVALLFEREAEQALPAEAPSPVAQEPQVTQVEELTQEPTPVIEIVEEKLSELSLHDYPSGTIDELFVPSGSDDVLESAFEPKVSFNLSRNLSIADRYLFANELFFGNQGELMEVISEIERMSSWSQAESYLYDTLRLKPESEEVERFAEFIKNSMVQ